MATNYLTQIFKRGATPQSEQLADVSQVPNSAGGFVFGVDDMTRLRRFLILGSEGGSFYASERDLTKENVDAVRRAIAADGLACVREIVDVSVAGRAPKNDPALFALALCAAYGDDETRAAALAALPRVARTGTHLFHFAAYVDTMRGWGRGLRNAVGKWYSAKDARDLVFQVVKYQQRDGWSHRDLLRLTHAQASSETGNAVLNYAVKGWPGVGDLPHPDADLRLIWAHERAKTASEAELVSLIREHRLPMESVPTEKRTAAVYEALIPTAGITWLLRNLGNLSKHGVIATGQYSALNAVCARLTDAEQLKRGRVHPLSILSALDTYRSGKSIKGGGEWPVVDKIVDALDTAFYSAFDAVEPTGKRFVCALDVSGSMDLSKIAGMNLTAREASAALALVTNNVESNVVNVAFTGDGTRSANVIREIPLNRKSRLDAVVELLRQYNFGGTDCALPMLWALENDVETDAFVIYTDSETWAGTIHPVEALTRYRQKTGIPARLIIAGMTSNGFSIADTNDAGMLDVVGFSTDSPSVVSEFAAGRM